MTGAIPALAFEIDPRRFFSDLARMKVGLRSLAQEARATQTQLGLLGLGGGRGGQPRDSRGRFLPFPAVIPGGGGFGPGGGGVPGGRGGRVPGAGAAAGAALGGRFGFGGAIAGLSAFAALRSTISTIADFEQAIATLQGVTGATGETLKAFEDTARQLGATTRFTATEAAEGLLELARAGLSADDALAGLPATLNLAQAGLLGLGEASDLATNVAAQFGLGAQDIERISDALVGVANRSNTTVAQLGQGLKDVGGVAAGLGTDLETTVSALGVLANVGLKGSDASIKLRQAFLQLLEPSAGAQSKLAELGLTLEDVDIRSRGLIPVLESLGKAQIDVGDAAALVGARNALALSVLSQNADRVREFSETVRGLSGATRELADIQRDTLAGSLKSAASAVQELQLAIGEGGLETATRATVDLFTAVVRELAGVKDESGEASVAVQGLAVATKSLAAAIGIGGLLGALGGVRKLFGLIAAINPFARIVIGAGAAAVAISEVADRLTDATRKAREFGQASPFGDPGRLGVADTINRGRGVDPARAGNDGPGVLPTFNARRDANNFRRIDVETVTGPRFGEAGLAPAARGLGNGGYFLTGGGGSGGRPPFRFQTNDVVAGLQQEAEALRRVGADREAYIVAIQNGIPATEGNIAALREQIDVLERLGQSERIADGIASSIINIGVAADLAAGNTERAVERMVRALSDLALQELALQPLRQALQSFVGGLVAGATPRQGSYGGPNGYGGGVFVGGQQVG